MGLGLAALARNDDQPARRQQTMPHRRNVTLLSPIEGEMSAQPREEVGSARDDLLRTATPRRDQPTKRKRPRKRGRLETG